MSQIIALKKAIEDAETGALTDYHVLTRYYVDETSYYVEVGFATYVSEKMYLAGRRAVGNGIVLKMNQFPPRGEDVKNWFYQAVVAPVAEGVENGSVLVGAEFVYVPDADAIEADTATE